jgi:hypothetical protein
MTQILFAISKPIRFLKLTMGYRWRNKVDEVLSPLFKYFGFIRNNDVTLFEWTVRKTEVILFTIPFSV